MHNTNSQENNQKNNSLDLQEMLPAALEAMLDSSTDILFIKDKELKYVACSRSFAQMVGLSDAREVVGKTDYDLFDRELAEQYLEDDHRLLSDGSTLVNHVEQIPSETGSAHYSCTSKFLLRNGAGEVIGLYGIGRDITENREAYDRLKLLTDNVPSGIIMYEASEEGIRTLYLSDGVFKIVGYPREEYEKLTKDDVLYVVFEEDRPMLQEQINELLSKGTPMDCTYRIAPKDCKYRWVNIRGTAADRTGGRTIVNTVLFDVTEQKNTELELAASYRTMELASQNGGISFWLYNMEEKTVTHNTFRTTSNLGYPSSVVNVPDGLFGTGDIAPEHEEVFQKMHQSLFDGAEKSECTIRILNRSTKKYEWQHIIYTHLDDSIYKTKYAIGFAINVDLEQENRLRYEHELQLRRELIKNSLYYYQINLTKGIIEEYHTNCSDVLGIGDNMKVDEKLHHNLIKSVAPEDVDKVVNTLFSDALYERYKRGETSAKLVYRRKIDDKGYRWVEASASIMEKPNSSEVIAFLYSRNIDVEKKDQLAIEAIMDEEIESVAVINVEKGEAHFVQIKTDYGGVIRNQSFQFDEKFKQTIETKVLPEDQERCSGFFSVRGLKQALDAEEMIKLTYRTRDKSGSIRRKNSRAFFLDESKEEIVLIRRDITDLYEEEQRQKRVLQRAIDAANAANQSKSDFLSHMSHDMRTPLNAVLSFSDEEMTGKASEEQLREYLGKIHSSGDYLLGIINDVLDMSKIEQQKVVLNPEPYTVDEFVVTIRNIIEELSKNKNINFVLETNNSVNYDILVDKVRFNQIFINLLSNAVKFTPAGGKIELIIEPSVEWDGNKVKRRFLIRDTGIGMSPEFLPHAFESFRQEYRKDVADKIQGTGLGLAIVKELVALMHGTISVESELGKGTTFTIELPLEVIRAKAQVMEKASNDSIHLDGLRILLCEDNDINTEIALLLLEKKGCIVDCTKNGLEALEQFKHSEHGLYDVILMDIRMPVMDGIEASREIRRCGREDAKTVPIIAMTADAFNKDEQVAFEAGMNHYISKPIVPHLLYQLLSQIRET